MRLFTHKVLVLFACLVAACLPYLSGKVVCTGSGGHFAVEPRHTEGACDESQQDTNHDESPRTCQDFQLDLNTMMARGSDRAPSVSDVPLAFSQLQSTFDDIAVFTGAYFSQSVAGAESLRGILRDGDLLRTIVLLT
jgi:hypothetical protein